jgi:hypothetical protein
MRRLQLAAEGITGLILLADLLHRASHHPWQCDDSCLFPWGKWHRRPRNG